MIRDFYRRSEALAGSPAHTPIAVVSPSLTPFADLEVQKKALRYQAGRYPVLRYPRVIAAQPPSRVGWKGSIGLSRGLSVLILSAQVNLAVNLAVNLLLCFTRWFHEHDHKRI